MREEEQEALKQALEKRLRLQRRSIGAMVKRYRLQDHKITTNRRELEAFRKTFRDDVLELMKELELMWGVIQQLGLIEAPKAETKSGIVLAGAAEMNREIASASTAEKLTRAARRAK